MRLKHPRPLRHKLVHLLLLSFLVFLQRLLLLDGELGLGAIVLSQLLDATKGSNVRISLLLSDLVAVHSRGD